MNDEAVARDSRGRALEASGYKVLTDKDKWDITQETKQIYFHAGRWSGGARDHLAREAYRRFSMMESGIQLKQARNR